MIGVMGRRWENKTKKDWHSLHFEQSLASELYTRASAFSHARGLFRVSSVSLDGLRKKQDGS